MSAKQDNNYPEFVQEFISKFPGKENLPLTTLVDVALTERKFWLPKIRVARELKRSSAAISQALAGENNTMLYRIIKLIQRYDRAADKRKSQSQEAA
jgi:hypothetical protein